MFSKCRLRPSSSDRQAVLRGHDLSTVHSSIRVYFGNSGLVLGGFAVFGAATFVFVAVGSRGLSDVGFSALMVWFSLTNLIGLAFAVFETYVPRALIARRTSGNDPDAMGQFVRAVLVANVGITIAILVVYATSLYRFPGLSTALVLLLTIQILIMSLQALQRGFMIATSHLRGYLVQFGTDGISRASLATIAWVIGADDPAIYAGSICVAGAISLAVATPACGNWLGSPWQRPVVGVSFRPILALVPAIVGPLMLSNAAVPWLSAQSSVTKLELGAFGAALTVSRVPTLVVGAITAPMLRPLATAVERRDRAAFAHAFHLGQATVAILGFTFVALLAVAGPFVLSWYVGPEYEVSRTVLILLGITSSLVLVASVGQTALVAFSAWRPITVAWILGILVFAAVLAAPLAPFVAAAAAGAAGMVGVTLFLFIAVRRSRTKVLTVAPAGDTLMRQTHG